MDSIRNGDGPPSEVTAGSGVVALGGSVTLRDLDAGSDREVALVTPEASNPRGGSISIESPLGQALLGRRVGELVEARMPARTLRLVVTALRAA